MKSLSQFTDQMCVLAEDAREYLEEKLIKIGKGKPYGQIVFLAGGAGSGKGFASSNFLESDKFKVRDVDEWKKALIALSKISKTFKMATIVDKFGETIKKKEPKAWKIMENEIIGKMELSDLNLKTPNHVFVLHAISDAMGIKNKTLTNMLNDVNKGRLPNIMFDITAKDVGTIKKMIPLLQNHGYEARDINLVWVLTNYSVAVDANRDRERVVPEDILLKTHEGAANTVYDMVTKGTVGRQFLDGGMYVILNNRENTIFYTTGDTKKTIRSGEQAPGEKLTVKDKKGKEKAVIKSFTYLTIKEPGKPVKKEKAVLDQLLGWIKDNIPKTKKTADIFGK